MASKLDLMLQARIRAREMAISQSQNLAEPPPGPSDDLEKTLEELSQQGLAQRQSRIGGSAPRPAAPLLATSVIEAPTPSTTVTSATSETSPAPTSSMSYAPDIRTVGDENTRWNITPVEYLERGLESVPCQLSGLRLELQRAILRNAEQNHRPVSVTIGEICRIFVAEEDPRMMDPLGKLLEFYFVNYGGGLG